MSSLAILLKEYAAPASATSGLAGYWSGISKPKQARTLKELLALRRPFVLKAVLKGDLPGHEFHGNQYVSVSSAAEGKTGSIGSIKVTAFRVGATEDSGRGVFFAGSKEGADEYRSLHEGYETKEYQVEAKNAYVTRSHMSLHRELFGGKTFQDAVWLADKSSGFKSSVVATRKVEAKMARALRGKGHDALIYTGADAGKAVELSVINPKTAKFSEVNRKLHKLLTDRAAHAAATSYLNLKPQPTDDQKHAGNYTHGHLKIAGLDISIENPAGSHRRPEWSELRSHYGYIRRTEGADGDHVDCFVRVGTPEDYAGPVHVVNQRIAGTFDEHKVMLGWLNADDARAAYLENYERGWSGLGSMVTLSMQEFKTWLAEGDTTKPLVANLLSRLLQLQIRRSI